MHKPVMDWVEGMVEKYGLKDKYTLEVGSRNVNGSVRELFSGVYFGVDMVEGYGVNEVMNAHDLKLPDNEFEVVVSTEMLEHDSEFWQSMKEMGRVLKPGGHLIITARGNGFPEHSWPSDYYRFMPESTKVLIELAGCEFLESEIDDPPGIFGIGRKWH